MGIPERREPDKKWYGESILLSAILSRAHVIYKPSERMKLNDVEEATQLASMNDQGDYINSHSVDSGENQEEPAEDKA